MYRFLICLGVVASLSLVTETASAGHGRRIIRAAHRASHAHVVHHVPVVRQTVVHVVPSHHHVRAVAVPHVYHYPQAYRPAYVIPSYGYGVIGHYGHARIYVGRPVISLGIGGF